jgi:hypothetical protein
MQSKKTMAVSINEAAQQSPVLSRLSDLIEQSRACMNAVTPCLPFALRKQVSPGPIEGETWCILAHHNAVASKLKQLKPDLELALAAREKETGVKYIRIRVVAIGF